jgi:serine/threonine protein kinase
MRSVDGLFAETKAGTCDFGLGRFFIDNTLWRTKATQAGGTLRWMAPELLEGEEFIPTKASDIYAYAMTCYVSLRFRLLRVSRCLLTKTPTGDTMKEKILPASRGQPSPTLLYCLLWRIAMR